MEIQEITEKQITVIPLCAYTIFAETKEEAEVIEKIIADLRKNHGKMIVKKHSGNRSNSPQASQK